MISKRKERTDRFCDCIDCMAHEAMDDHQQLTRGRWFPAKAFKKHEPRMPIVDAEAAILSATMHDASPGPGEGFFGHSDHGAPIPTISPTRDPVAPQIVLDAEIALNDIQVALETLRVTWQMPAQLHFKETFSPGESARQNLDLRAQGNSSLLVYEEQLVALQLRVDDVNSHGYERIRERRREVNELINEELSKLDAVVTDAWLAHRNVPQTSHVKVVACDERHHQKNVKLPVMILRCMALVAILSVLCGLNRVGSEFALGSLPWIVRATPSATSTDPLRHLDSAPETPRSSLEDDLLQLPKNLSTVMDHFNLDPEVVRYTCCPRCFSLYPSIAKQDKTSISKRTKCTHKPCPEEPECGAHLYTTRGGSRKLVAIREFIHQPLSSWLKRFLSRPVIRQLLEKPLEPLQPTNDEWHDIWDMEFIRDIFLPKERFSHVPTATDPDDNADCRLVFSLFVDWFNPYKKGKRGRHYSTGVLFMACLNLPYEIRFNPENIYLAGVIPGPKEPSLDETNHLLKPLVDDLEQLWSPGVRFTWTTPGEGAWTVRCALSPLVCDLKAARKAAGFASDGATCLCSFCKIRKGQIRSTDYYAFPSRDWKSHWSAAKEWQGAATRAEQDDLWKANYGVRWSELLRLSYWDPIVCTVLDAMHNMFLGLLCTHCRNIFGMSVKVASDEGTFEDQVLDDEPVDIDLNITQVEEQIENERRRANAMLESRNQKGLSKRFKVDFLRQMCETRGIVVAPLPLKKVNRHGEKFARVTRAEFAAALVKWHEETYPERQASREKPPPKFKPKVILGSDLLSEVWHDMADTTLPTWMTPGPLDFGSPSHGTLKADEWRTVCTVNLVITLVQLWSGDDEKKTILRNFLDLITAVKCATTRTISRQSVGTYLDYIKKYLTGLKELWPKIRFRANHHMSFHLVDCLLRFGPAHGWWSFPFERYNGILGDYTTNHKPGEMEKTFMFMFCRSANLKAVVMGDYHSEAFEPFKRLLEAKFPTISRGTLVSDTQAFVRSTDKVPALSGHPQVLPPGLQIPMPEGSHTPWFYHVDWVEHKGIRYNVAKAEAWVRPEDPRGARSALRLHPSDIGNSLIEYRGSPGEEATSFGQIIGIFIPARARYKGTNTADEIFVVVAKYRELSQRAAETHDPYTRYPGSGCRLLYNSFRTNLVILHPTQIVSHFARCPYRRPILDKPCIVACSLNRDSPLVLP